MIKVAFTDYPLQEIEKGKEAPIRPVLCLSYDGGLYLETYHPDFGYHDIKAGYIYYESSRSDDCKYVSADFLNSLPESSDRLIFKDEIDYLNDLYNAEVEQLTGE